MCFEEYTNFWFISLLKNSNFELYLEGILQDLPVMCSTVITFLKCTGKGNEVSRFMISKLFDLIKSH